MIGDKRDESFTSGYQSGFAQAIVASAIRAGLADSPQAAAVAIRELDLAAHDQESREDHAFTAGYDEGLRKASAPPSGEPEMKNAVCFACEGDSGLPPSRNVQICESCYDHPDDARFLIRPVVDEQEQALREVLEQIIVRWRKLAWDSTFIDKVHHRPTAAGCQALTCADELEAALATPERGEGK